MKKLLLAILALVFTLSAVCLSGCGKFANAEEDAKYTVQDAVKEVGYAFYRQELQINYNQTIQRRMVNPSPEEATAQHMMYLDCSSYVNAVYYEAFGENILPYDALEMTPNTKNYMAYARENPESVDVVGVWLRQDYSTATARAEAMAEAKALLQVGDVVNYRKGSTGHVMLYVGDDNFLHSTGDDFNVGFKPENSHEGGVERVGSVGLDNSSLFFDETGSRYMLKNSYEGFCILRPLARELELTDETKARMLSRGLDAEKTADKGVNTSLAVGEEITYTLTIKNHRDVGYKNVEIKDVLDANLEFVSGDKGVSNDGQNVVFNKKIKAGETITLSWTAKVKETAPIGAVIVSDKTTVGGISQAIIKNSVSKFSLEQLNLVASKAKEYALQGKVFANPIEMAKQLYKDALNVDLLNYENVSLALDDVIVADGHELKETDTASMVAPDMYGGRRDSNLTALYIKDKDIVRLITTTNLSVGDVIVAEYDTEDFGEDQVVYVYVGGDQVVSCFSKTGSQAALVTMTDSIYESSHVLVTIYAYNRYAVLRPSMAN